MQYLPRHFLEELLKNWIFRKRCARFLRSRDRRTDKPNILTSGYISERIPDTFRDQINGWRNFWKNRGRICMKFFIFINNWWRDFRRNPWEIFRKNPYWNTWVGAWRKWLFGFHWNLQKIFRKKIYRKFWRSSWIPGLIKSQEYFMKKSLKKVPEELLEDLPNKSRNPKNPW